MIGSRGLGVLYYSEHDVGRRRLGAATKLLESWSLIAFLLRVSWSPASHQDNPFFAFYLYLLYLFLFSRIKTNFLIIIILNVSNYTDVSEYGSCALVAFFIL